MQSNKDHGAVAEAYEAELRAMVADCAPRLFAVVQECDLGTADADGWIAAWGVLHEDGRADVTSVDGALRGSVNSAERAARWFGRRDGISARVVWLGRSGVAPFA